MSVAEYDAAYARMQLRRAASPWRRVIKAAYLAPILRAMPGPAIDLGCGAGQLLRRLPAGSIGLEVNPHLVTAFSGEGLEVRLYDPRSDGFRLEGIAPGRFYGLVLAHALEHLEDPANALATLLASAARLALSRVLIVVPTERRFCFDPTHRSYIDHGWLASRGLLEPPGWRVGRLHWFPIDHPWPDRWLTFHELHVLYERA